LRAVAGQSPGGRGSSVGRRSSVSSSSASFASCHIGQPSPRAIRSRTSVLGLPVPASIARRVRTAMSAASANASWVSPVWNLRRPMARPSATWGVGLGRTREARPGEGQVNRRHASCSDQPRMEGYSMSRSSSAGVVPRARASRRSVRVVASVCAFSSSLMNDRSTPLRWASLTCESPLASRDARRLRAS